MTFEDIFDHINLLIPGYKTLSPEQSDFFQNSIYGEELIELIGLYLKKIKFLKKLSSNTSFIESTSDWLWGTNTLKLEELHKEFELKKRQFFEKIENTTEFQSIKFALCYNSLKEIFPDFLYLNEMEKIPLVEKHYSQTLLPALSKINFSIEKYQEQKLQEQQELDSNLISFWNLGADSDRINEIDKQIDDLNEQKKLILSKWHEQFLQDESTQNIRDAIQQKKEQIRIEKLMDHAQNISDFFPLLFYKKSHESLSFIQEIKNVYLSENNKNLDLSNISSLERIQALEIRFLSEALYHILNHYSQSELKPFKLESFNKKFAENIAKNMINSFYHKECFNIAECFQDYDSQLFNTIIPDLKQINGKVFQDRLHLTDQLKQSLSYIWEETWKNKHVEGFKEKMKQSMDSYADAHAFIQATSFSSQNDNSLLSILDMYNYGRVHEKISEAKNIVWNILKLISPLYREYKDIALHEKSTFWKVVRILIPIIILVSCVVLMSVFLAKAIAAAAAAAAVCVLSVIIGIGLATLYTAVKNRIYHFLKEQYYGGPFAIPEFQVNQRMIIALGQETAADVRQFYTTELAECDRLEKHYEMKFKQGILTEEDILSRKDNTERRNMLSLEWYDIHSNYQLSIEKSRDIIKGRLQKDSKTLHTNLENALNMESPLLKEQLKTVSKNLKNWIVEKNIAPLKPKEKQVFEAIEMNYQPSLFKKPKTLEYKQRLEQLDDLSCKILQIR